MAVMYFEAQFTHCPALAGIVDVWEQIKTRVRSAEFLMAASDSEDMRWTALERTHTAPLVVHTICFDTSSAGPSKGVKILIYSGTQRIVLFSVSAGKCYDLCSTEARGAKLIGGRTGGR